MTSTPRVSHADHATSQIVPASSDWTGTRDPGRTGR